VEEKEQMTAAARSEIERGWIERARALQPALEAAAPRIDAACALPEGILDALFEARMFRMLLPHTFGGAELEPATFFQAVREIAAGDASAAWCIAQSSGCSMSAAYMEPAAAHKVFGDSRAAVAWGYSMGPQCRATPVKGGWRVNGTWGFGSGNRHATWVGAHCHRTDEAGEILTNPDGSKINFNTGACSPGSSCKPPNSCNATEVNSYTPYPSGTFYRRSVGIIVKGS
jgi:alkylation response protein AidB-like acyl-CoA dehydrogenase